MHVAIVGIVENICWMSLHVRDRGREGERCSTFDYSQKFVCEHKTDLQSIALRQVWAYHI